jgi:predicted dehydrogenase
MGVDVIEERCKLSQRFGAAAALKPDDPSLLATLDRLTGGHGADCIFLTAGSSSNAPTELAVKLARDRGRVVDVGKTRLDLPWNDYYLKELDVRFSRSYGPGRYDTSYEEQGIDYPIGYVRWTEKRNIAAFLDLVASGHVEVEPIISSVRRYADADQTYADIANAPGEYLGIVFDYEIGERAPSAPVETSVRKVVIRSLATEKVRVGAIGAGNYAASMLFPHLHKNRNVELLAVATTTSLSAENAKQKFNFKHACTDYKEVLQSPDVDAVIIATRHSSHATLVAEALRSGKATYVEKPLALSFNELEKVRSASVESKNDRLMVGFNRRFSPMIRQVAHELEDKKIPLVLHYRVHAGRIEGGSWYLDAKEGSRFIGEAGHFFDVLSCLAKARPVAVTAACLRPDGATRDDLENIVATVEYDNGSIGTVAYLTQGGAKVPKEFLELLGGGVAVQLDNFESLVVFEQDRVRKTRAQLDKGQKDEMEAFVEAVRTGGPMPIPIYQLFDTTLTTLGAAESRRMSARVDLTQYWAPAY